MRLYYRGQVDPETVSKSYAELSWDQYFTDLSMVSIRQVLDGERRDYRLRAWQYAFKNLALVDRIFSLPIDNVNILDIGCSSGYLRRILEGNYSHCDPLKLSYWGIDMREDFLARAVYAKQDIESGAEGIKIPSAFVLQDVTKGLPFVDDFFNVLVSFGVVKYLPIIDSETLLRECHRVLAPGGTLYISTSFRPH